MDTVDMKQLDHATSTSLTFDSKETYYHIKMKGSYIGGSTIFEGFEEDGEEIRVLRPVIPENLTIALRKQFRKTYIINSEEETLPFLKLGGDAIIKESILVMFLPEFFSLLPAHLKTKA